MTTSSREQKTLDWYTARFEREYRDARMEYERLSQLFKDVCWYNFETTCRLWKGPWRQSVLESHIELFGMCFERSWRRGCLMEHGRFPAWYAGTIRDAPDLPPQIVLHELKAAKEYMEACAKQVTAPYDWAPGGVLFQELARQTLVGKARTPSSECVYAPKRRKFSSC